MSGPDFCFSTFLPCCLPHLHTPANHIPEATDGENSMFCVLDTWSPPEREVTKKKIPRNTLYGTLGAKGTQLDIVRNRGIIHLSSHSTAWLGITNNSFRKCRAASAPPDLAALKAMKDGTFNRFNIILEVGNNARYHFQGLPFTLTRWPESQIWEGFLSWCESFLKIQRDPGSPLIVGGGSNVKFDWSLI